MDNPRGKDFTNDIKEMEQALTRIDPRRHRMRDALRMSLDHVKSKGRKDKKLPAWRSLIGNDNSNVIALENLVKSAQQSES